MAGIAFPSWAYQNVSPFSSQIVLSSAALTALGSTWSQTPSAGPGAIAPFDPGFPDTDIRLQQLLIEARISNQLLYANAIGVSDDPSVLRADVLATDAALAS